MRKTFSMLALIALFLIAIDASIALGLHWAEAQSPMGSLVRYFEYGRSVPGKLARWKASPDTPENLYDVAWRPDILATSAAAFAKEPQRPDPIVRSYGMSFTDNIIRAAQELAPDMRWDSHSGPGAPPNYTFALFQEDRASRRPGDIVVLGILSSSVPAMAALSNRTWAFEQPAPFTYPIFRQAGAGLERIEPFVKSAKDQRAQASTPTAAQAWADQLAVQDNFYSPITFGVPWLDGSPIARLIRRSLAKRHIEQTKMDILAGIHYPYTEILNRMIIAFAQTARADGQFPIVMLIQTRNPMDVDVAAITRPTLERESVPYLATTEHFDPRNWSGFLPDGHYKPNIDAEFGKAFQLLLPHRE